MLPNANSAAANFLHQAREARRAARTCTKRQVFKLVLRTWEAQEELAAMRAKRWGYAYDLAWVNEQIENARRQC